MESNHKFVPTALAIPSEGARFYYIIGLLALCFVIIGFDIIAFWFSFDGDVLGDLIGLTLLTHGCLSTARRLAPIPDEIQRDAQRMADLGLPRQTTEQEMTRMAIVIMSLGVVFTIAIGVNLIYGIPFWLSILTFVALGLSVLTFFIAFGLPPFGKGNFSLKPPFLHTEREKSEKIEGP